MHDLLKTLLRPDRDDDPERSLVAQAANILQVGEFQVLQLAYHEWFGRELPEHLTDRLFKAYMLQGQVPSWAHDYATRIVRQDEIDLIDSREPAYHRYDQNYVTYVPSGVRQFTIACLILASIFVVSIFIGQVAGVEATSVLPPYFEESELNRGP